MSDAQIQLPERYLQHLVSLVQVERLAELFLEINISRIRA